MIGLLERIAVARLKARVLRPWIVILASSAASAALAQGGSPIVVAPKKSPTLTVSQMTSEKACPSVEWLYPGARTVATDGSVYGVTDDGGRYRVQRCVEGTVTWSLPVREQPSITLDPSGGVTLISRPSHDYHKAREIQKITPDGKRAWRASLVTNGDSLSASARGGPGDGSVYVAATTDGLLDGASPSAKGKPSISKYDAKGKRVWLTSVSRASGIEAFDVDAKGNVFVLTRNQDRAFGLLKIGPSGKFVFERNLKFKKGAEMSVDTMHVDRSTGDVYLALSGEGRALGAARLRNNGDVVWARLTTLKYAPGYGEEDSLYGAGVLGGTLYIFRPYDTNEGMNEYGGPSTSHHLLVLGFRAKDGRPLFAQMEFYSSMDASDTANLGNLFSVPGNIRIPLSVSASFPVAGAKKGSSKASRAELPRSEKNPQFVPTVAQKEFLIGFQKALARNDKEWVANHARFPLQYTTGGSREEFMRHFNGYLPPELRERIQSETPADIKPDGSGILIGGQVDVQEVRNPTTGKSELMIVGIR